MARADHQLTANRLAIGEVDASEPGAVSWLAPHRDVRFRGLGEGTALPISPAGFHGQASELSHEVEFGRPHVAESSGQHSYAIAIDEVVMRNEDLIHPIGELVKPEMVRGNVVQPNRLANA